MIKDSKKEVTKKTDKEALVLKKKSFTLAPSYLSSSLLTSSYINIFILAPEEDNFRSTALVLPCVSSYR